jgi:hypothetical protein
MEQSSSYPLLLGTSPGEDADLASPHYGDLPLALLQHPSLQLSGLALVLLVSLSPFAPIAAAASALAVSLASALLALTAHAAKGSPSARHAPASHATSTAAQGPRPLAAISLDMAVAIAAASWLAVWAFADPPGPDFWLRWQPTLVLALVSFELLAAALVGMPCAYPLLVDKCPPLLLRMGLPDRPVTGSPASPPWLRVLARDVTLAWGLMAGLAAASCAVPAALGRHAFPSGDSGMGMGVAMMLFGGKHYDGGGGSDPASGGSSPSPSSSPSPMPTADPLDVALSVCVPLALGLAALFLGDALCERARRAQLPRMAEVVAARHVEAAAAVSGGGGVGGAGGFEAVAAPPSGVLIGSGAAGVV